MQSSLYVHGRHPRWKGKRNLGLWEYKGCAREEEEIEHKKPAKQWLLQAFPSKLPCSPDFSILILISAWHPECCHPTLLKVLYPTCGAYHLTENFVNSEWKVNGTITVLLEIPTKVRSFRLVQTKRKCCLDPLTNFLVPSQFQTRATQIHAFWIQTVTDEAILR